MSSEEIHGMVRMIVRAQEHVGMLLEKIERLGEAKAGVDLSPALAFVSHPIQIPEAWTAPSDERVTAEEIQKKHDEWKAYNRAFTRANQLAPPCPSCSAKMHVDTESGKRDRPGAGVIDGDWLFTCPKGCGVFPGTLMEAKIVETEGPC